MAVKLSVLYLLNTLEVIVMDMHRNSKTIDLYLDSLYYTGNKPQAFYLIDK